eukprot:CAMPEP_0117685994 /NCGR_PEP_ID=MMETSP0804-20121206/22140_1 /TAXON_ID=1074897 /ORGANISM="Tetraselmis astigmatica, Strain CCMP880" /LENGTH=652 /DNA_ID=CAMNT_0005497511 /DNA_START=83 /DNA_END=2042 /DNA_ORIENTATION=-
MPPTSERNLYGVALKVVRDCEEGAESHDEGSELCAKNPSGDDEPDKSPLLGTSYLSRSLSRIKSLGDVTMASMRSSSPVPLPQMLSICLTQLTQAMQVTLPYTIGVFIVRDFGYSSEAEVSRKTGMLAANFCLAMFLTAYFWGRISDTYGRKGVVVVGNLASAVAVVMFGLSGSYSMACTARFLGGFFNGIFGAVKTILGESCSAKDQGQALLFLSISWGVGTILGPTLFGGVLAQPCEKFHGMPWCSEGQLFHARPFALPCLLTGAFSLVAFVASCFMLTETFKRRAEHNEEQPSAGEEPLASERRPSHGIPFISRMGSLQLLPRVKLRASGKGSSVREVGMVPPKPSVSTTNSGSEEGISGLLEEGEGRQERVAEVETGHVAGREGGDAGQPRQGSADLEDSAAGIRLIEIAGDDSAEAGRLPGTAGSSGDDSSDVPWWKLRRIRLTLMGYGLVAFIYNLSDEVTPIYASTVPSDGGLGFTTSQLGVPLSVSGVALLVYALAGYKRMQNRFGVQRLARLGLCMSMPVWVGAPLASLFLPSRHAAMAVMCLTLALKSVAATSTFTSSMVMVNVAAPPKQLGQVNGAGQSIAAFVRGAGPAVGGLLWSLSINTGLPYHQFLVFSLLSLMSLGTTLVYYPQILHIPGLEEGTA